MGLLDALKSLVPKGEPFPWDPQSVRHPAFSLRLPESWRFTKADWGRATAVGPAEQLVELYYSVRADDAPQTEQEVERARPKMLELMKMLVKHDARLNSTPLQNVLPGGVLWTEASEVANGKQQFVAYLRASPETHLASAGPATGSHLLGEVLKQVTGANVVNVQYKGTPAAMTALLAGETQAGFMLIPVVLPHIKAGRIKAYATTGKNRFAGAPAIPTMAELGMGELESEFWLALMAPARTPDAIIAKVNRDAVELLKSREMREALLVLGAEPMHSSPQELAAFMRSETAKWKKVIETAGVRLE